jgi:hypothetical protein
MSETNTVSPLRQRMIEDTYDRRYGCAQTQPAHAAQPYPQLQAVRRLAQTLARYGNARRRCEATLSALALSAADLSAAALSATSQSAAALS